VTARLLDGREVLIRIEPDSSMGAASFWSGQTSLRAGRNRCDSRADSGLRDRSRGEVEPLEGHRLCGQLAGLARPDGGAGVHPLRRTEEGSGAQSTLARRGDRGHDRTGIQRLPLLAAPAAPGTPAPLLATRCALDPPCATGAGGDEWDAFRFAALLTLLVVVVAGAAESLVASEDFPSTWDGIWWAVVTVTTVGYGDVYPTTAQGRIVAMVVMLFGIGFLSVLTATVASRFVKTERSDETHEILAALAKLEAELAELRQHVAPSHIRRPPVGRRGSLRD
jgi:hypothetical protein